MVEPTPAAQLLDMLYGYRAVQVLYAAAVLGIADQLRGGPRSSDELAATSGAHAPSLHRLLRVLSSLGVLVEAGDGCFALTPMGELLCSDTPGSLRAAVLFCGGRRHWTAWAQLFESVKTGKTAFLIRSADKFAEMAARDPTGAAVFHEAMEALTGPVQASVIAAYDFSKARIIVDVGGGYGLLLASILKAQPKVRGVLFDIAPVIEAARGRIEAAGLTERCDSIAGDFFEAVPAGGDVYVLKWILHDWDDELSIRILTNCRRAMHAGARLLIVERVLPARAGAEAVSAFLSDLNMLLLSGGAERSEQEYLTLLAAAGFELRRIVPIAPPHHLLEASPV